MLILSRRESEQIVLGENIILTVVRIANDKVRIGVIAPENVKILRTELEDSPAVIPIHEVGKENVEKVAPTPVKGLAEIVRRRAA